MRGKGIIIPASLHSTVLDNLHINHMGIEKTRLLACKSMYWINMNADIEDIVENFLTCLDLHTTQTKDKTISHKIPGRPWGLSQLISLPLMRSTIFVL